MKKMDTPKDGKSPKAKKTPRPNGMFLKPIAERAFEKKYLKKIGQQGDRNFLASCFQMSGGAFNLRPGLDRDALLRLNTLAKVIKSNRGIVSGLWTGVVLVLVIALAVFGLFFMNPLIEKGAELGLQAVFGAKAEVDSLRFDPFRMNLSVSAIRVADSAAPMTNLFETGRIDMALKAAAIFRGKIYIEKATAASIALGTPRKTSGALPGSEAAEAAPAIPKEPEPPIIDFQKFDAMARLEQEKARLASTKAYAEAGAAYDEASARWKARVEASRAAVAAVQESGKKALAIDLASIKTVAQATAAIETVKKALAGLQTITGEAQAIAADMEKDSKKLATLAGTAKSSVSADLAYLKSFVDPKSGAAMASLEPMIRNMLSDKGDKYLYYGQRGLTLLGDLKAMRGKPQDPEKAAKKAAQEAKNARLRGRDVYFPSRTYPLFCLEELTTDFPIGEQRWAIRLTNVSTDPDLIADPTELSVAASGGSFDMGMEALANFRTDRDLIYKVEGALGEVDGKGIASGQHALFRKLPLDLKDAFAKAGLGGFSGTLGADLSMVGLSDASMTASLGLAIDDPRISSPSGTIGTAVAGAVSKTGSVRIDALWKKASAGGEGSFSLKTNLDKIVQEAVAAIAGQYAKKAAAEVEKALRDYVARELEGKLGSKEEFDSLFALAKGDKSAVESLKKDLDQRLKDLEAKAKAAATGAAAGAIDGLKVPKLP